MKYSIVIQVLLPKCTNAEHMCAFLDLIHIFQRNVSPNTSTRASMLLVRRLGPLLVAVWEPLGLNHIHLQT